MIRYTTIFPHLQIYGEKKERTHGRVVPRGTVGRRRLSSNALRRARRSNSGCKLTVGTSAAP